MFPFNIRSNQSGLSVLPLHRVQPEGGFQNPNWKPDMPKHNFGSSYRKLNMFFSHSGSGRTVTRISNPYSGSGLTGTGNWEYIFSKNVLY